MEQSEIDELQAYINQFFTNKKIITMPQTFYVAEKNGSNPIEFVSGIDGNGDPTFSQNIEDAQWSFQIKPVEDYISENNIENVKPKQQGGNHPPRPPLSA